MNEIALMLDMGRKFFTKDWIIGLINYMKELRMNTLHLHFSENEGFRIECKTYPQIVSKEYLSKKEIAEIINYANQNDIQIIPEFDTPGHLKQILTFFPQCSLKNNEKALDITSKDAREFIKTIYKEYAELFNTSSYFHIGADEFIDFDKIEDYPQLLEYSKKNYGEDVSGMEAYIEYTNEIADYVKKLGFTPRVWSDGFFRKNRASILELTRNVEITYWTRWNKNMAEPKDFIEKGYKLINYCDNYFYYVLGENAGYTYPDAEKIKKEWTLNRFPHGDFLSDAQMKSVKGVAFSIWCDKPEAQTQEEVFAGIKEPLKAMTEVIYGK